MSLLDNYKIHFEYHENYPDIMKMIMRARAERKKLRAKLLRAKQKKSSYTKHDRYVI